MKRFSFMLSVFITTLSLFFALSLSVNPAFAVNGHGSGKGHDAASEHAEGHATEEYPGEVPYDRPVEEIQEYLAPMNELEIFPCSECHDEDWEVDETRRELEEPHNELPGKFQNHDSTNRWCLDCHSAKSRDNLRLINGDSVPFNEYYRLCEQCHKRVYREWKMGVHGKRTGLWNGEKQYMHCTQCHDPHNPPFKAIEPMPAPRTPLNIKVENK